MYSIALFLIAFVPMILEARRSRRNENTLRAAGALEPANDVYAMMQIAYPASFLGMVAEAWMRGSGATAVALIGAVVFLLAKAIKYWAIATLGDRWTFRVLVPPRSQRTLRGPYRWLRHPNYVGVAGEIVGFALLAQAPIAGVIATAVFALLLGARIRVEERALGLRSG